MCDYKEQFLLMLKSALNNEKLPDGFSFDADRVFVLAQLHNMLPFVFEKALETDIDVLLYKKKVVRLCSLQINKNQLFRSIYEKMLQNGLNPLVVKGPVCAGTYKTDHYRLSSDFDIVFPESDADKFDAFFCQYGFDKKGCAYISEKTGLYIETSYCLGEGADVYAQNADNVFNGFFDRAIVIDGYRTLSHNDHFAYLIYHAFKHFIGSGFGVKQLADMYMYMLRYNHELDYSKVLLLIDQVGIRSFADNCFYAISRIFDYKCELTPEANSPYICYDVFVNDLLDAGVFGKSTEDRLHSASVVYNAVSEEGKKNLLRTLFPSFSYMKNRFSILNHLPFLLPVFWIVRIFCYLVDSVSGKKETSPVRSIEIANERIDLMKKMGII